jgi:DNA repair protein SbcD/Mre11
LKFAHTADCHLGGWRDLDMREVNTKAFKILINTCIEEQVEFLIISGDLFNNSFPPVETVKLAVEQLMRLKKAGIRVFGIAGSHDYSPTGKTMLDVLESAGLFVNVARGEEIDGKLKLKFTRDEKTGALLTGIFGRRGGLDHYYYKDLERESLAKEGFKIFVFHAALTELKPKHLEQMDTMGVSYLPKDFSYYAGGDVHIVRKESLPGYQNIVYPGPVYPNNFAEVEKLGAGNFCIYDNGTIRNIPLKPNPIAKVSINCDAMSPGEVSAKILEECQGNGTESILALRLHGRLREGRTADINFTDILARVPGVIKLRNTYALHHREFEEIKVPQETTEVIEENIIAENTGQAGFYSKELESSLAKNMMNLLSIEQPDGMTKIDFHKKIVDDLTHFFSTESISADATSSVVQESPVQTMD